MIHTTLGNFPSLSQKMVRSFFQNLFRTQSSSTVSNATVTSALGLPPLEETNSTNEQQPLHKRGDIKRGSITVNTKSGNYQDTSSPNKRKRNLADDSLHDMLESYSPNSQKKPTTPDRSKQLKLTPPQQRVLNLAPSNKNSEKTTPVRGLHARSQSLILTPKSDLNQSPRLPSSPLTSNKMSSNFEVFPQVYKGFEPFFI